MDSRSLGPSRALQLEKLTLAVSYAVGFHPQCFAGTAILIRTANHFGIDLIPRAVALTGQAEGYPPLSTGTYSTDFMKARGAISADVQHSTEGAWEGSAFRTSGHMIAFDDEESMLLDPSFEQFGFAGMPNTAIAVNVDISTPEWVVALSEEAFVVYLPDGDTGGWNEQYEAADAASASMSLQIASHLASGGSADSHLVRLDLDGAILR